MSKKKIPAFNKGILTVILVVENDNQIDHAVTLAKAYIREDADGNKYASARGEDIPRMLVARRGDGCIVVVSEPKADKLVQLGIRSDEG